MDKYIDQLLEDLRQAAERSPFLENAPSSFDPDSESFEEEMFKLEQPSEDPRMDTIEYYCGIPKEQLPPQEKLTEKQMTRLVKAIKELWLSYYIFPELSDSIPVHVQYRLMREEWQVENWMLRSGGLHIDFCNGDCENCELFEYCESGQQVMKEVKEEKKKNNRKNMLEEYMDLPNKENFIPSIYNYCNRWCEKCHFTERCLLFAREKLQKENPGYNSDNLLENVEENLQQAQQMLEHISGEMNLEEFNEDDAKREKNFTREVLRNHSLYKQSLEYTKKVHQWMEENQVLKANGSIVPVFRDELEIIWHYDMFIGVKIMRVIRDLQDTNLPREFRMQDAMGSAKLALIGMRDSRNAWMKLLDKIPDQQNKILDFCNELKSMYESVQELVPGAMDFIRPGLDEE